MSKKIAQNQRSKLGIWGEKKAVEFLVKHNFQILEQNYKYHKLEIDIIALDLSTDEITFIEVKTRKSADFGEPALAVNYQKLANLQTAAQVYLLQNNLENSFRFDIISILPNSIKHFKNITVEMS